MFNIKGKINGIEYTLTYKDDKLFGDKIPLEKAIEENKKDHGNLGVIPGDADSDYLKHECAAIELITRHVFDEVIHYELDWYDDDDENTFY